MKSKIIFLLPIALLLSCAVEKESSMITEKKAGRLSIQMKHYFLETLKRTYGLEDDAKLFEKFLEGFVHYSLSKYYEYQFYPIPILQTPHISQTS